ncbi:MAG: TlpA family protein disulfide reductase [Flavobacteriales bacterium]|jgi:thiol-disulfide isomerase/thioredoxin
MNKKRISNILFYGGIAAVLLFFYLRYKVAPNLELSSIQVAVSRGEKTNLDQLYQGSQIIHFYASWCGPCMRELPELVAYSKETNTPLTLVTDDAWEKIEALKTRYGVKIVRVESLKDIGVYSIPLTYFVNSANTITRKQLGEVQWQDATARQEIKTNLH